MQQVTIDHVYPEYANVAVLYPEHQRQGIVKVTDALDGEFAEDATIVWKTLYDGSRPRTTFASASFQVVTLLPYGLPSTFTWT